MTSLVSFGFLAPPTVFIALCLVGALIALRWRRMGIALVLASSLCLLPRRPRPCRPICCIGSRPALPPSVDFARRQAIIVLGGDVRRGDGADIPDRLGPLSLERVALAAEPIAGCICRWRSAADGVAARSQRGRADEGRAREPISRFRSPGPRSNRARPGKTRVFTARLLLPEKLDHGRRRQPGLASAARAMGVRAGRA